MIGIDTNILVRFLVQDDPEQCKIADRLIADASAREEKVFINVIVLCETAWVLSSVYGVKKSDLADALKRISEDPVFDLQKREEVEKAIAAFSEGSADFADYLIGVSNKQFTCSTTYTFDVKLKQDKRFSVLKSRRNIHL